MYMFQSRALRLVGIGAITVLLAGCTLLTGKLNVNTNVNENGNANINANINANVNTNANINSNDDSGKEQGKTKSFTVEAANFSFSVKEIKVKKGDVVKIHLVNKEGFHDWNLDEFNAKTPQINGGQTADIEFVAGKTGTFEYYCSVGQHRAMGMVGKLIVE